LEINSKDNRNIKSRILYLTNYEENFIMYNSKNEINYNELNRIFNVIQEKNNLSLDINFRGFEDFEDINIKLTELELQIQK